MQSPASGMRAQGRNGLFEPTLWAIGSIYTKILSCETLRTEEN